MTSNKHSIVNDKCQKLVDASKKSFSERNYASAIRKAQKALSIQKSNDQAIQILASSYQQLGDFQKSLYQYNLLLKIHPDHSQILCNYAILHYQMGELSKAIELLKQSTQSNPNDGMAWSNLGMLSQEAGDYDTALEALVMARKVSPGNANALCNLGNLYQDRGEKSEALECFEQAIKANAQIANNFYSLINLGLRAFTEQELKLIEQNLTERKLSTDQKSILHFAKALNHQFNKDWKSEFEELLIANKLFLEDKNFSIKQKVNQYLDILETPIRSTDKNSSHTDWGELKSKPIFVVGMPRSGTTLVEQILASHSNVTGAGELVYMGRAVQKATEEFGIAYPDMLSSDNDEIFLSIRNHYMALTAKYQDNAYFTDKLPANFYFLGIICRAFPEAKIVHCQRHPAATAVSCFRTSFEKGNLFSFDLQYIAEYYEAYLKLMAYWEEAYSHRILEYVYEAGIFDLESNVRKLLEFCDLPWQSDCLNYHKTKRVVATASNTQVRKPLYSSSVNGWKRYQDQLAMFNQLISDYEQKLNAMGLTSG